MSSRGSQLLSNPTSLLLCSTVVSLVLGLGSAALQARILGPVGRAELAVAMVPGGLGTMLLCFGLPDFVARKAAQGIDTRRLSRLTLVLSFVIALVVIAPVVLLIRFQAPVGTHAWVLLLVYAISLPAFIYGYGLAGIAIGSGFWRTVALARVIPGLASVLGLTVLILIAPDANPLQVGLILICVTALSPALYLVRRGSRPAGGDLKPLAMAAVSFGARGWGAGAIALINQRIDLLMMTVLVNGSYLGYYAVATTLAAVLNAVANSVALPARNRASRGDYSQVAATAAATMLVVALLAVILIALLPVLVRPLLGVQYLPAIPVMRVLVLMQIPLAGVVVLTQSLIGAGFPGAPLGGEIVALVVTAVLIVIFYPIFGILAAAFATGIGNLVSFTVLLYMVRTKVRRESAWRYVFISPRRAFRVVRNHE